MSRKDHQNDNGERRRWAGFGKTIVAETKQIVTAVEELTGLTSRWNGGILILADASGEARTAGMLSRVSFLAKKEWNCGITVLETVLQDDLRWRTLLHEVLHSVSVGLTEPHYQRHAPWEEAVVEYLQRLYRPLIFARLGLELEESLFQPFESIWRYNRALEALGRIAAERSEVPVQKFMEDMLRTSLPDRPAFAFEWGRESADFYHFKQVYAAASGFLRSR